MSSPFAYPERNTVSAASPPIKVESEADEQHVHWTPSLEQSLLVSPDVSSTHQRSQTEQPVNRSAIASSFHDVADQKPAMRHDHRRTHSAAAVPSSPKLGRQRRVMTRPENASCSCEVCGKLFQRCYNLKSHMDTHNPHRPQPHKCAVPDCGKSFVRRTDLLRHDQSVSFPFSCMAHVYSSADDSQIHLKARDFICPLCGVSFARKDTWRRYVCHSFPRPANDGRGH